MIISIVFFSVFFLLLAPVAHAYIDPGTGSMLLQVLIGSLAGAFVVGRKYIILTLKRVFFRKNPKAEKPAPPTEDGPTDNELKDNK